MKLALIGLSGSGKTTVFDALKGSESEAHPHGRFKEEVHLVTVPLPDLRLNRVVEIFRPEKVAPASIQYADVGGVRKGEGRLPGEAFLREADALLLVVRAFRDPAGESNPLEDLRTTIQDLVLADLEVVERRLERLEAGIGKGQKGDIPERDLFLKFRSALEEEKPLRVIPLEDEKILRGYGFLTAKPLLVVFNIGEEEEFSPGKEEAWSRVLEAPGTAWVSLCGKLEMEMTQLEEDEREAFEKEMGKGLAREDLIRASHDLLGFISFFTVVGKETRAWTIPRGTTALKAAGAVHSDMERGFIRAEVVPFGILDREGSWAAAKEAGLIRLEGKQYIVQDGDIIFFRFKV